VRDGDIVTVTIGGPAGATLEALMETPQVEFWPQLSLDGRWLAYGSNESGRFGVHVRPYPALGAGEQVSIGGGESPAWHPAGSELFFVTLADSASSREPFGLSRPVRRGHAAAARLLPPPARELAPDHVALRVPAMGFMRAAPIRTRRN
jgi:hypothetical protein